MRNTFSWRHALALLVMVCLLSIVAGAVLAQEPELPEPEVPVFDLSGSAAEPAQEPDLPDAVNPVVVIEPAAVNEAPTNLNPANGSVVTTKTVQFSFDAPPGADGFDIEVYKAEDTTKQPDGSYVPNFGAKSLTPTTPTSGTTVLDPAVDFGQLFLDDGIAYVWRVRGTDSAGGANAIGPWASALFTVDVPKASPTLTSTVITTTPLVTWAEVSGAEWYNLIAVGGDITGDYVVGWNNWYPSTTQDFTSLGLGVFEGICSDGQCKARPETELTQDIYTGEILIGNVPVQIYAATWSQGQVFPPPPTAYSLVTEFVISAPQANVSPTGGPTPGRPDFTVERSGQTIDELLPAAVQLLGMTETVYPDYFEIFILDADTFSFVGSEWFNVTNAPGGAATNPCLDGSSNPAPCDLEAYDGLQELLYNGNYLYAVRGYSSVLDGYTPYALGGPNNGLFTINEDPPQADWLGVAGIYESLGDYNNPNPDALTTTWVPCANGTGIQCETSRPYFHIQVNNGGFSGDWIGIAIVSSDLSFVYFDYFNVNNPQFFDFDGFGEYWYCDEGLGNGFFSGLTCFFRPGLLEDEGGLYSGMDYTIYVGSYGPGGASTGGTFGFVDQDFSTVGLPAVENLGVDLEGPAFTFTSADIPGFTETLFTGVPKFYWDDALSAVYYNVEITAAENIAITIGGTPIPIYGAGDVVYDEWHEVFGGTGLSCASVPNPITPTDLCAFQYLTAPWLPEGDYTASVVYYDGSISNEATLNFTVDAPATSAPLTSTMGVFANENLTGTVLPIFDWVHNQGNDFYNLQVFDAANNPLLGVDYDGDGQPDGVWYAASDICYQGFSYFDTNTFEFIYQIFCTVDLYDYLVSTGDIGAFLLQGDYSWVVTAFGPSAPYFDESPPQPFSIDAADTTPPVPIWPLPASLTHTLTHTNVPTFYWEASENASWYQVFVGRNVGTILGVPEYETYVLGYFYRPIATSNEQINDYFNNGITPCYDNYGPIGAGWVGNTQQFIQPDPDTIVCDLEFSANGDPVRYYNDPLIANDNEYEWYVQPISGGEDDLFGPWQTMGTFGVQIPASDPVWHGASGFFDGVFQSAMRGNGTVLNGGLYESLFNISWRRPISDERGTETLAYEITIYDTASNQPIIGPAYLFADDVFCGPDQSSTCFLSGLNDFVELSPYGVYEVLVGVIGQGEIDWSDPDALVLLDIVHPPSDGSYGPARAKFTKL